MTKQKIFYYSNHILGINNEMSKSNIKVTTTYIKNEYITTWLKSKSIVIVIHIIIMYSFQFTINMSFSLCVLFNLSFFCMSAYVNVYPISTIIKQNIKIHTKHKNDTTSKQHSYVRGPLRECRSIRSGASRLPYYCAPGPLVYISVVIELLTVWRHNKPKTKNQAAHHPFTSVVSYPVVPILIGLFTFM